MHYSVQKASAHETNMDTWHMANQHDNSTRCPHTTRQSICTSLVGGRCSSAVAGRPGGKRPAASSGSGLSARLPGCGPQGACCRAVWAQAARCLAAEQRGREGLPLSRRAAEPECLGAAAWGGGSVGGGGGGVRQAERPRCETARGKGAGSGARFTVSLGNRRNSSNFFVFGDGWEPNFGGKFEEFLSKFKKFKKIILISVLKFRFQ